MSDAKTDYERERDAAADEATDKFCSKSITMRPEDGDYYEGFKAGYDAALKSAVVKELATASGNVERQAYGLKNNWCGEWVDCKTCGVPWAVGWNWNDCEGTDPCPDCSLKEALTRYNALIKELGEP